MTEDWTPKDKAELMTAIEREWELLIEVADKLTDTQMTTPDEGGWSPKDNLAHLSEWMNVLIGYHLDHRPNHEVMKLPEEVTKAWNFEVINPVLFERNKNRSRKDVMDELKYVYAQLHAKLERMEWEELMQPRHADDPEKRPVLLWVLGDTTEHFLEHRETIERGLKENS
jgi:hypothetical protein